MNKKRIFALGFFDGVHLGHQALLQVCCKLAAETGCQPAAITFLRHPQSLFTTTPPALINSDEDRERLLRHYGISVIYKLPVTEEVMSTSWEDFLGELLEYGAAGFVCGDDFRFGHKGEGNAQKLAQYCRERDLRCSIVPEQTVDGIRVSSTHIRSLIEQGDVRQAEKFLGHPHILSGKVISGQRLGRRLGMPTANLQLPEGVVCPRFGVYACNAHLDGHIYPAATNIGVRPTVSGTGITVEPWLLDFSGDLYGKSITLTFHKFLREERKFDSLEELKAQIQIDAAETYRLLK